MVNVQGTVADGFEPVRDAFRRNLTSLGDRGSAVTVYRDGQPVVDLWGGVADAEGDTPWQRDTAQILRSATKGPAAAVLHLLHQRGTLDPDAPVGTYWPEFKANGKERVLVRHLLSHRAGLPVLDTPLTPAEALDGVSGPRAVAAQAPEWEPGTEHGYHPHTWSWLLAELVLRVTGLPLGRWFAEEVAAPLGLDLWIGLPDDQA
ncbi:serine hydrolase domain-containing protein, partial [Streptomyces sparsus]